MIADEKIRSVQVKLREAVAQTVQFALLIHSIIAGNCANPIVCMFP